MTEELVFRDASSRASSKGVDAVAIGFVSLLGVLMVVILIALEPISLLLIPPAALIFFALRWITTRPRLVAGDDGLNVVNHLTRHTIPWTEIQGLRNANGRLTIVTAKHNIRCTAVCNTNYEQSTGTAGYVEQTADQLRPSIQRGELVLPTPEPEAAANEPDRALSVSAPTNPPTTERSTTATAGEQIRSDTATTIGAAVLAVSVATGVTWVLNIDTGWSVPIGLLLLFPAVKLVHRCSPARRRRSAKT